MQTRGRDAVLVFPGGMERALDYSRRLAPARRRVIGASSLAYDPARSHYADWLRLPPVTDGAFERALGEAIEGHGIGEIFTPHPVIGDYLERRLPAIAPGVRLTHDSLLDVPAGYRFLASEADRLAAARWSLAGAAGAPPLSALERRSLFHYAEAVPGQCSREKIWALVEALGRCPAGDLVEIGSLWGKSAFVIAWLARRHGLGALLCVDPWSGEHRHQNDNGGAVNGFADRMDFESAFEIFQTNLFPFAGRRVNFLRLPSAQGAAHYAHSRRVENPSFGRTDYCGRIAFLHIDGNHDHCSVERDLALWTPHLLPGAWVVLDDYRWAFGDGPRRAGDEWLARLGGGYQAAFVAGTALFIRLAAAP